MPCGLGLNLQGTLAAAHRALVEALGVDRGPEPRGAGRGGQCSGEEQGEEAVSCRDLSHGIILSRERVGAW